MQRKNLITFILSFLFITALFQIKGIAIVSAETLVSPQNNSTVGMYNTLPIELDGLLKQDPNIKYTLTLYDGKGSTKLTSVVLTVSASTGCSVQYGSDDSIDHAVWGMQNGQPCDSNDNLVAAINTAYLQKAIDPSSATTSFILFIEASNANGYKSGNITFSVERGPDINVLGSDGNTLTENPPKFYEGSNKVNVSSANTQNCTDGITLTTYYTSLAVMMSNLGKKNKLPREDSIDNLSLDTPTDIPFYSIPEEYKRGFEYPTPENNVIEVIEAKCNGGSEAFSYKEVQVKPTSSEWVNIPTDIQKNTPFSITLGGLTPGECYAYRISSAPDEDTSDTTTFFLPDTERKDNISCADWDASKIFNPGHIDIGYPITVGSLGDDLDKNAKFMYGGSSQFGTETSVTIGNPQSIGYNNQDTVTIAGSPGLPEGQYYFYLYKPVIKTQSAQNVAYLDCILIGGTKRDDTNCGDDANSYVIFQVGDVHTVGEVPPLFPPCGQLETFSKKCAQFSTAFGLIDTEPGAFVGKVLGILLSVSGGIALLIIIRAAYILMTSRGDPEKIQDAKEQLTSAIVGLLFMIFSLVILEVIGVDILHIPGFAR